MQTSDGEGTEVHKADCEGDYDVIWNGEAGALGRAPEVKVQWDRVRTFGEVALEVRCKQMVSGSEG